ncbi:hypothetical protein U0070_004775, partial [Myodes glareolus]
MSKYKEIVLLKGLERMEDYNFRIIKSLLRKELRLSERIQKDYDRIHIADLMEDKFPKDAGLSKLIGFCEENKDLKYLVEELKAEKAKVEKPKKRKNKTAVEGKQGEPSSSQVLSSNNAPSSEEQTQLLEPSGSNTQKDESCSQTPQKPPPTSSSNSSNKKQKTTNTKKQSTLKTDDSQQKHQLLGFFIQAPHAPPLTMSGMVCAIQKHQGVASSTGQALPCPKVKAPRCALAPQTPSAKTSESLIAPSTSPPTASKNLLAPVGSPATTSSSPCTPRRGNIPKDPAKEEGCHRDPKEVMVLKVTEPFTYDLNDGKMMFHATVATENEFFTVKIFDPVLKNKFIPNKIIAISNYFGLNEFLEIYQASCVSDVDKNRMMDIPKTLKRRADATPKIKDLISQAQGTYVNGEFVVYEKTERNSFIYYGIEDDTGTMEVVVYGRLTSIKCEPGQKLRLICFELSSSEDKPQLKSVRHSNM